MAIKLSKELNELKRSFFAPPQAVLLGGALLAEMHVYCGALR